MFIYILLRSTEGEILLAHLTGPGARAAWQMASAQKALVGEKKEGNSAFGSPMGFPGFQDTSLYKTCSL